MRFGNFEFKFNFACRGLRDSSHFSVVGCQKKFECDVAICFWNTVRERCGVKSEMYRECVMSEGNETKSIETKFEPGSLAMCKSH